MRGMYINRYDPWMDEQRDGKSAGSGGFWRGVMREPLVHFLAAAVVLLLLRPWSVGGDGREVLVVTSDMVEALEQIRADAVDRPLTETEKAEVVEGYIEEEVLVREARKLGFANDARVRQHLVMKMGYLFEAEIREPTEEDLRAMYEAYPDRSVIPERVTLDLITVGRGEGASVLGLLREGEDPVRLAQERGRAPFRTLPRYARHNLEREFGVAFADRIMGLEEGDWVGPFETERGDQLVRLKERFPERRMAFEEVEAALQDEWTYSERERVKRERIAELRGQYEVVVQASEGDSGADMVAEEVAEEVAE